jgi:hypothetical protein
MESMHKVVFSGHQVHRYPLLINDVGNAQRYRVRLSDDLSERRFALKGDEANAMTFSPGDIILPDKRAIFIEYEGTGAGVNDQVFFVRHIDAIKLNH